MPRPRVDDPMLFVLARMRPDENGCWRWTSTINHGGYGIAAFRNRKVKAHRLAYEAWVGPIPDGLTVDHLCYVRDCVNPKHLDVCTGRENKRRAWTRRGHLAYANGDARIAELCREWFG